ncbi:hypothetical protein L195_g063493, partial [Trifolium pratense]
MLHGYSVLDRVPVPGMYQYAYGTPM